MRARSTGGDALANEGRASPSFVTRRFDPRDAALSSGCVQNLKLKTTDWEMLALFDGFPLSVSGCFLELQWSSVVETIGNGIDLVRRTWIGVNQ